MPIVNNYAGWTVRRAQANAESEGLELAITDGATEYPPTPAEMPRQISQNDESTPPGSDVPEGTSVVVWLAPVEWTCTPERSADIRNPARP